MSAQMMPSGSAPGCDRSLTSRLNGDKEAAVKEWTLFLSLRQKNVKKCIYPFSLVTFGKSNRAAL